MANTSSIWVFFAFATNLNGQSSNSSTNISLKFMGKPSTIEPTYITITCVGTWCSLIQQQQKHPVLESRFVKGKFFEKYIKENWGPPSSPCYMRTSGPLKIDRYCPLVMQGFSNFLRILCINSSTSPSPNELPTKTLVICCIHGIIPTTQLHGDFFISH